MQTKPITATAPAGVAHQPLPHESAPLHVSGGATYIDDIAEAAGTLHAALGLSERAHARLVGLDLSAVRAAPGVRDVIVAADIPGENDCGPIVHDDPILADGCVQYLGQPIFAVIADSHAEARRAARLARVDYEDLPATLTPQQAHREQSYVLPPLRLTRGDAQAALQAAPFRLRGEFYVGGQEQFYLEGQISYALPQEGGAMHLWCSTQHPTEMQQVLAHALNLPAHAITVAVRRLGGGFGGKESQSALFAAVAAIAAQRLQKPVKLRLDRDDDMLITGKRHCFHYDYEAAYDSTGRILALRVVMVTRAGFSADLSGPVATRAMCHVDNAYYLSDVDIRAFCGKTNTQSNTAFRGFGGPQGAILIEHVIDSIARSLGRDPLDLRKLNYYGAPPRDVTPYGQRVEDNVIAQITADLEKSSDYEARRAQAVEFNRASPILKKGLAFTPVKFGISFNVAHYNQAGALVHVYTDGSVLVNHGGCEMGQGLHTKVAQVVAAELGLPLARVRATSTDTSKIANTSATAASTGADLNGMAAQQAAARVRARLAEFTAARYGGTPQQVYFADDCVSVGGQRFAFADIVQQAYQARVQLWADGFYATPKLHWDKKALQGHPFYYYAYGAAVSEVLVDTLTGEWKLLRADLLHDAGNSINPAIDLGQVEGGFIQGMGWLTLEELWWNEAGRLMTHSPSTYKIPAVHDCPADFRVRLFPNRNVENTVLRSKAVGEPPLLLAFSVFFALRDAIASLAEQRINPPLDAPATPEAIMRAVAAVRMAAI
ncbi:MAG: xanthine dehydrogenase molybdopterin binding subunit [Rhodocyclaceae bacterium]|nr:xanthine dehydrogenase molybdopterin binding subunit [Rhodocyclaceae bacterium]MBX3669878.1 xanthine dehydrogenase molybdopterin binding subunit [Rhodocyclaceae bacterium]